LRITAREREIIQWCAAGKTAIEIAAILGRSHRTIQNEIFNVQRKLNVVNAAQMIAESFRYGILR
jgi:LuxR family quorum sensing-dependent transcriptional regulator